MQNIIKAHAILFAVSIAATIHLANALNTWEYYYTSEGRTINLATSCDVARCVQCPAGQFRKDCGGANSGTCISCTNLPTPVERAEYVAWGTYPAGIYQSSQTAATVSCPFQCKAGSFLSSGSCTQVSPGYFSLAGQTSQTPCPAGSIAANAGSSQCTPCAAGTKANLALAATSCDTCPSGQKSAQGSITCAACEIGTHSIPGGASCSDPCPAGKFASTGATACGTCAAGTISTASGQAACENCASGKYSPAGVSVCTSCATGSFASASGTATCPQCLKGTYASAQGLTACVNCPGGKITAVEGASSCTPCAGGTAAAAGSSACTPCAANSYAPAESSACTACATCGTGLFKSGCGGANAGICDTCSNEPP